MSYVSTGFFGVPGSSRGKHTVHVVMGRRALCGWKPRIEMEFQWCAHGIEWGYIECERCKLVARKLLCAKLAA